MNFGVKLILYLCILFIILFIPILNTDYYKSILEEVSIHLNA